MKKRTDCYSVKQNERLYKRFRRRLTAAIIALIAVVFFGGTLKHLGGLVWQGLSLIIF